MQASDFDSVVDSLKQQHYARVRIFVRVSENLDHPLQLREIQMELDKARVSSEETKTKASHYEVSLARAEKENADLRRELMASQEEGVR